VVLKIKFQPIIKWSGSKRSQSELIINEFPKQINNYYEPFVGGGSIVFQLIHSDIKVNNYFCSDINEDLINLWNTIKNNPKLLINDYTLMWKDLNKDSDLNRKKKYFYDVRERFNKYKNPSDFLFISRTTTNGLIRYNKKGEFNNSFHVTRNGIIPNTLNDIICYWSNELNKYNVYFEHKNYSTIQTKSNDFIYLDPPYAGTKGMYYGTIDYNLFWDWIRNQPCGYALSFDGKCGHSDRTYDVPNDIYSEHKYIYSGCSSFKRLKEQKTEYVQESLYVRY
jgi:DNA adenine methylase